MSPPDFCAFILTHGRPHSVFTYDTLKECGYTGPVYLVIDDEDDTGDAYREKFGDQVLTFSKSEVAKTFDEGDNFSNRSVARRSAVYAYNVCFALAKQLKRTYFIILDDDYTSFAYKLNDAGEYVTQRRENFIRDLDAIFTILLDYYRSIPALSIAFAQSGDFLGGKAGNGCNPRKCMNTFICSTEREFSFPGRLNCDVTAYTSLGRRGALFLTISNVSINQKSTQATPGGMTEIYLDAGTYVKSFYSVMYSPSCVKISEMLSRHRRIHHSIKWAHTAPMIIDGRYRKARAAA